MPAKVIKRNNLEEDFKIEKLELSIEKAANDAGLSKNEIFDIVEDVSSFVSESLNGLETVDTKSLRSLILSELDKKYPKVSDAWRKYDKENKGRID